MRNSEQVGLLMLLEVHGSVRPDDVIAGNWGENMDLELDLDSHTIFTINKPGNFLQLSIQIHILLNRSYEV